MSTRLVVAGLLLFAALPVTGYASACINNCQPLVSACSDLVTPSTCGHTICLGASEEVPFCKDIPPTILACGYESQNTAFVGVTYTNCTQVDGYVCTDVRYFGGHGIWGLECVQETPFSLP